MNTEKIKVLINYLVVAISTFSYAAVYWFGNANLRQAQILISTDFFRPWVYRQLVPVLARAVSTLGVREDISLTLIVVFSGIGFYHSLRSLSFVAYKKVYEIETLAMFLLGLVVFGFVRMPYDIMTAWLFTLSVTFFLKKEMWKYILLFPLVCLNRETAFLLTILHLVLIVYERRVDMLNMFLLAYQVFIWSAVRFGVSTVFSGNGGESMWIEPVENAIKFIQNPFTTILHLSVTVVLLFLILKDWNMKSVFLRIAFVVLFPILSVLYVVLGQAYETRVFWEIWSVVILLSCPTLSSIKIPQLLSRKTLFERT